MKYLVLSIIFAFLSSEIYAAASSASICKRRGGTWNQWSRTCKTNTYKSNRNKYKKSYGTNKYKSNKYKSRNRYKTNRYKKNNYNRYGTKNKYKKKNYNRSYKKKTYSNYNKKKKSRSVSSVKQAALAYCWQSSKSRKWSCDGPLQKLWSGYKSLDKARGMVGCKSYSSSRAWSKGTLFNCGKKLKSYDRNIRGKYGISKNY
ncbi:MAG: hypothetical protein BM556_16195 [Bacteriovorax sp. MedPE-SWde]|nr:MAG: hypothetical protein BM556_16195 [Bacteriovorax sp. MedPE-SWde]